MSSTSQDNNTDAAMSESNIADSQEVSSKFTLTGNNATVETSESILIVGATGLTGQKIVKNLARISKPDQTLFVFSRTKFVPVNRPNVINKVLEPSLWPAEIAKIPNLTTVYSALGARSSSRFINGELFDLPSTDKFINVNYNLNLQVAIASKLAGVQNFILISNYLVGYTLPKVIHRKTKVRALVEKEIAGLQFKNLLIFRPGPLVGTRGKIGSLKNYSVWSIIEGLGVIAITPFFFFNVMSPCSIFSFATTVGKASSIALERLPERDNEVNIEIYNAYRIISVGTMYNRQLSEKIIEELRNVSSKNEDSNIEDYEQLSILLFGESLFKYSSINNTISSA